MNSQGIYISLALFPVFTIFFYSGFYIFSFLLRLGLPFFRRNKKNRIKIEKFFNYFFMIVGFFTALDFFLLSVWIGCSVSLAICTSAFIRLLILKKQEKSICSSSVD